MSRASLANLGGVLLALLASMAMAIEPSVTPAPTRATAPDVIAPEAPPTLTDATGAVVDVTPRARIVSASTVADQILLEVCDASQLIAVTELSATGREAHRFAGRPVVRSIDDTEAIVALAPDLVLVHNVADQRRVARLREAGLTVYDLGVLEGVETLLDDIVEVGTLCGARGRAIALRDRFRARLSRLRASVETTRRSAIYLAMYGDRFFGGTAGSSYHDVLAYAGLDDAAAARYRGWPQYGIEEILELDPDVVVTRDHMRATVCRGRLATLRACREGRVVEIDGALLDDPGLGILEAAEAVQRAAYP